MNIAPHTPAYAGRLPQPVAPFVGREAECTALLDRLCDPFVRLVTIVGQGGAGKTRLALQVAQQLAATVLAPEHGIVYVALAAPEAATPEETLITSLADACGLVLSASSAPSMQVRDYVRERSLLLILDGFEHVLAASPFIAELLAVAPRLRVLITSRIRLNVRGEITVPIAGLSFPAHEADQPERHDAVQLFVQLALATGGATPTDDASMAIAGRICRLVEGLPLAIELAAAWTRVLTVAEIEQEISRGLDFLSGGARDLPERQRSLRAVSEASWQLLSERERQVLAQLSVFRGSFTRAAAEAVAVGPLLQSLTILADASLVRRADMAGAVTRYKLPELVREYAAEQLARSGDVVQVRRRHASYYLTLVADEEQNLRSADQRQALARIGAEIDQIRAAWSYALAEGDSDRVLPAAGSLFRFYDMRSWFAEGADVFGAAARVFEPGEDPPTVVWARLLARQAWFVFHLGRPGEARAMLERSLEAARALDALSDQIFALSYLGAVCFYLGDWATTETQCRAALRLAEAQGDLHGRAVACNILGQTAYERGDCDVARTWCQEAYAIEQGSGNTWSMTYSLTTLGNVAVSQGRHDEARQLFQQALETRRVLGDVRGVAGTFNRLGETALELGATDDARTYFSEALRLFREIGNTWGIASSLAHLGRLAAAQDRPAAATPLFQEALRLALATGAAPLATSVVGALTALLRRAGETAWADTLAHAPGSASSLLTIYRRHEPRLLAWRWPGAPHLTVDQAIVSLHAPAPPPTTELAPASRQALPSGLTPREVEVLRLVAHGLTDAQVAERLVLSPRTVSTHLTSIYGKLQVTSRSAATRFAIEHHLA